MKYIFYFLLLTAVFSCKKDEPIIDDPINYNGYNCIDNNEDFKPIDISDNDYYELIFYNNSKIKLNENSEISATIVPGENIVFRYFTSNTDSAQPDSFIQESIIFEIENYIENFILSDNNIEKACAEYVRSCYCPNINYRINDGCIKGQKLSKDEWQIDINVTIVTEGSELKMISEIFNVAEK